MQKLWLLGPVFKWGMWQKYISLKRHLGFVCFFSDLAIYNYYKPQRDSASWNSENWAESDSWADGQWIKSFISTIEQLHTLDNRSQFSSAHKEVYQFLSACPAGVRRQITRQWKRKVVGVQLPNLFPLCQWHLHFQKTLISAYDSR